MSNPTPKLTFRDDVKLTDPIAVCLPAGEWIAFMNWVNSHDTDGINYLLYDLLFNQIAPQIYTAASLKATEAHIDDQPKTLEDLLRQQFPGATIDMATRMDGMTGPFTIVCDMCGSRDKYPTLPFGPLTCGCNGPRHGIAEA